MGWRWDLDGGEMEFDLDNALVVGTAGLAPEVI